MADSRFLAAIGTGLLLGDGACGTELGKRSGRAGSPCDELTLSHPDLVRDLHREYVAAGARLLRTNTFQANRLCLEGRRLGARTEEINGRAVRLAREAVGDGFVAGSVGPLGSWNGPLDPGRRQELYAEQCRALAEEGCDLILLETFMDLSDLKAAIAGARETGLPVAAAMAAAPEALESLARWSTAEGTEAVQVLGVNCVAPDRALRGLAVLRQGGPGPRCAFPSAGLPGREMSPDAFAQALRPIVADGARLVGGCCGAGPEHIRRVAGVLGRSA
jgi:methionine synthase I (cobalamin-dependent)